MTDFDRLELPHNSDAEILTRRRIVVSLIGLGLVLPLVACGQSEAAKGTGLNVVMYSYLDRPIYDIIFNGTDLGVANKYGGTGTVTGVRIPFGVQTLKWSLDGPKGASRNGEHVVVKNTLVISPEQIPAETRYLGLHLYPDYTAEIVFSTSIPDTTPRGDKILSAREKHA
jgi:hypothetical protein